jgi:integrase
VAIFNRGGYWHYDFQFKGERIRGTTKLPATTAKPPANVRKLVKDKRERAALGEISRGAITLETAAGLWFIARAEGKKSARTTGFRLQVLLRHLGADTLVPAVDQVAIEAAIQARRKEPIQQGSTASPRYPAASTINGEMINALRPVLRYAKKYLKQQVQDIDWADLTQKQPRERIREFAAPELAAWQEKLPEWHRPILQFMARYGTRLQETFFHPDQFDGERVIIKAENRKNARTHVIPILPEHRADIASRTGRAKAAKLDTIWFREVKGADGEPKLSAVHWRAFQSASKKAQGLAGLKDARPAHDLRHHAATMALRRSKNMVAVKALLGHDNIQSTMRYAHSNEADVLEALGHKTPHNDDEKAAKPLPSKGSAV